MDHFLEDPGPTYPMPESGQTLLQYCKAAKADNPNHNLGSLVTLWRLLNQED